MPYVGGRNGNNNHDSGWSGNNIKPFNSPYRQKYVEHRDDFTCEHCGSIILEDFDPSTIRGNPVYQCGICENNNDLPFAVSDEVVVPMILCSQSELSERRNRVRDR